jgi:RimJ/RimL family protein N-acetyltransferase
MSYILETPRLTLREMTWADLDFVASMLADPEVMRYYPKCYSRDEAAAWLGRMRERYTRDGHALWLVADRKNDQPLGQVGLAEQTVEGVRHTEVGYLIHRPFWRQGYAAEAAAASRDYAFTILDKPHVISLIRPENLPSQAVARKLGMTPRPEIVQHGGFDHLVFWVSRSGSSQ